MMVIWNLLPLGHELVNYLEFGGGDSVLVSCLLSKCLLFCCLRKLTVSLNWEAEIL